MNTPNPTQMQFLGGAGTVTGSKTLISSNGKNILIDCGLFQGLKDLRELNWKKLPVDAKTIDAVILTHAHLDHCGYLPALVKNGFKGEIHCTQPTMELAEIILKDSAKIQEEDAERANNHKYGGRPHCKPLYTQIEAELTMKHFVTHKYGEWVILGTDFKFQLLNAGHILGSAMVELKINHKVFVFTGDIGRKDPMLLYPPHKIKNADYLIIESTYGDRTHSEENAKSKLLKIIQKTIDRGGILMIPSFAVERTQEILFLLHELKEEDALPKIPIYLDSPMGVRSTLVFDKYPQDHDLSKYSTDRMYEGIHYIIDGEESRAVVADKRPKIVLAGSGMLEGGRMLHYLSNHGGNENNTLLFVGFQAVGTRGRDLQQGTRMIKFFGDYQEMKCEIVSFSSMSAHADREEMVDWMSNITTPPTTVFLNHGEPHQTNAFRVFIESKLGWNVEIPAMNEIIEI